MQLVVRVYALIIEDNHLLVSDELIRDEKFTKFPGGGLEIGEGTRDCLKRELKEELNIEAEILDHFYTTDFYQQSAFNKNHQILSIYYFAKTRQKIDAHFSNESFVFTDAQLKEYENTKQIESFRWISLSKLKADDLSLPIDKIVAEKLLASLN